MKTVSKEIIRNLVACSLLLSTTAYAGTGFDKDKVEGSITFYTARTDLVEEGVFKSSIPAYGLLVGV